jgi:hypothetical protein
MRFVDSSNSATVTIMPPRAASRSSSAQAHSPKLGRLEGVERNPAHGQSASTVVRSSAGAVGLIRLRITGRGNRRSQLG